MRIEQYFLMTDYSLWEVILNGDSPAPTRVVEDKHQLKFNSHKDAKTLMKAIEKRFRGNTETKKVQKTLLKQQYQNFTGSSSESLDQIHDRLQKLKTHTLIWRNKTDLEEQRLDDLFNSLKIYEAEVKSSSSACITKQNIAFVSSSNIHSTTEPVSAAASVFAIFAKMLVSSLLNVDSLKEEPANYALMAFSSSSSSSDNEFDVVSYQTGLESVEARLLVDKQNESVFEEDIKLLKLEEPQIVPSFFQSTEQVKSPRHSVYHVETSIPANTSKSASPNPTNNGKKGIEKHALCAKGNPQHALKDKGVIDSGCLRHMIGNMSYLSNFEELNGGYVSFRGNPKGGKFDGKVDEGFLVGYSVSSNAFRVFKSRTRIVQETLHVNFLENKPNVAGIGPTWLFDIDSLTKTMNYQPVTAGNQCNPSAGFQDKFDAEKAGEEGDKQNVLFPGWSSGSTNPQNNDGDVAFVKKEPEFDAKKPESEVNVSPSSKFKDYSEHSINEVNAAGTLVPAVGQISPNSIDTFSAAGPLNVAASLTHGKSSSIDASQLSDDLDMPELEDITYSDDENDVFRNKKDERGIMVSKDRSYKIIFSLCLLHGGMVYRMDVKSAFLYGTIKEEVYACQPLGFEDPDHHEKVYKVVKALYGLHQAPRACQDKYVAEILRKFGLIKGKSASTPIDTEKPLLKDPNGENVDVHIYRSMIGSLMYLTSLRPNIMFAVCACARFQVTPKASHLHAVKRIFRYLKGKPHLGLWYPKDLPFDLVAYSDSDYDGTSLDRKSTSGGCQFLGCRLISWKCKKQTVVATLSTEAEYVATAS
nr:uncharacterized mitochondrial protein AtMg00810-like [Tanacetum cinerariifolium]